MRGNYSLSDTIAIVVANMIGTGIFVSLGFQLLETDDFATIITLWIVGGFIALCGAFVYSEIGSRFPESGGEYLYLTKLYHPSVGFVSGWLSSTIGFSAPIALSAILFGEYINRVFPVVSINLLAIGIILLVTLFHSVNHYSSSRFQIFFTVFKVGFILFFIIFGLLYPPLDNISFSPSRNTLNEIFSSGFAMNLVYVAFAYSGWNATAYIASEVENPKRNLPRSIIFGTGLVVLLYVLLNVVFLLCAPVNELVVKDFNNPEEIGFIAASHLFNMDIANIISIIIGVFLISSISSMVITGPRVIRAIANDYFLLKKQKSDKEIPYFAIWIQSFLSIILLLSGSFDSIITYTTFALTLFSLLTVIGVFRVRKMDQNKKSDRYKSWGYPITPIIFIIVNSWILFFLLREKTIESIIAIVIILVGFILYYIVTKFFNKKSFYK